MSSRLPITSRATLSGQAPSTAAPNPSDMGLGSLAQGIDAYSGSMDRIAQKKAQEAVRSADTAYHGEASQAEASYDGTDPNFAQGLAGKYDAHATKARAGLNDRELKFFDQANAQNRSERLAQAVGIQGRRMGQIQAAQKDAQNRTTVGLASAAYLKDTYDLEHADRVAGKLSDPDYEAQWQAGFEARKKAALEAVPEALRPQLETELTQQQINQSLKLHGELTQMRDGAIASQVKDGLSVLTETVKNNPGAISDTLMQGSKLISGLPQSPQRDEVMRRWADEVYSSAAEAMRSDPTRFYELEGFLQRDDVKAGMAQSYGRYADYVRVTKASGQIAQAKEAAATAFENELSSLAATGESTGFDPNILITTGGPIEGPVLKKRAELEIKQAKEDHALISEASSLSLTDYTARVELLKPKGGEADFAEKQKRYERAIALGSKIISERLNDPAGAVASNKDTKAYYDAYRSGAPGAGKTWADVVIKRQVAWGIEEREAKIYPKDIAKSLVTKVQKAPPDQRDEAMAGLWGEVNRFGSQYAGRALKELQAAGLSGPDAAVIYAAQGDPVMLGQYTLAQERSKLWKGSKDEVAALTSQVDKALSPLTASYGYTQSGLVYGDNLRQAALTLAKGYRQEGKSDGEAAQAALKLMSARDVIDDKTGRRVPKALASQTFEIVPLNNPGKRSLVKTDGVTAVRQGAYGLIRDYGLYEPEKLYGEGAANKNLAMQVLDKGQLINTDDGTGLRLVIPDPRGGMRAVLDKAGRPLVFPWAQVTERAKHPAVRVK